MSTIAPERVTDDAIRDWLNDGDEREPWHVFCVNCNPQLDGPPVPGVYATTICGQRREVPVGPAHIRSRDICERCKVRYPNHRDSHLKGAV